MMPSSSAPNLASGSPRRAPARSARGRRDRRRGESARARGRRDPRAPQPRGSGLARGRRARARRRPRSGTALLLALLAAAACADVPAQTTGEPAVVVVVRHAERAEDGTSDPPLSAEGRARAELVGRMLADAGVTAIHATDYLRTRETARPLAERLGLETEIYDGRDPSALLAQVRARGGRHLVVAHSNTAPVLVEALGGEGHTPIHEFEYDRLYVLEVTADRTSTVLLRYGSPFEP